MSKQPEVEWHRRQIPRRNQRPPYTKRWYEIEYSNEVSSTNWHDDRSWRQILDDDGIEPLIFPLKKDAAHFVETDPRAVAMRIRIVEVVLRRWTVAYKPEFVS
jgi:hypothetical protein